MISHKAMFMYQTLLIFIALCLGTPSEASDPCFWCNPDVSQSFLNCLTQNIKSNSNFKFKESEALIEKMNNNIKAASAAININGFRKDNAMIIVLISELVKVMSTSKNLDEKISDLIEITKWCYKDAGQEPKNVDFVEMEETMRALMAENEEKPTVQQPVSVAAASSYQENNQWSGVPYNNQQPQEKYIQQPSPIQDGAKNFAFGTPNRYPNPYGEIQQQPALPNIWKAQPNQPLYPYPLKNTNIQDYPYNSGIWNNRQPGNEPGWSNTGANAASLAYSGNEPQNKKDYIAYSGSSASAITQTAYIPQKNYDYNPDYPASYAFSDSPSVENNAGKNYGIWYNGQSGNQPGWSNTGANAASQADVAAESASSGPYSIENLNQKPSLLNISKKKKEQKSLISDNKQQQTDTNQQIAPSKKDDETVKCLKFSETLYVVLYKADSFKRVFHEKTSKLQSEPIVSYILWNGLTDCDYEQQTKKVVVQSSRDFMKNFPEGSSTDAYAEGICKMIMVLFEKLKLIGDDPDGQAKALGNAMLAALKKLQGPVPKSQNKDNKADVPLTSQQKLSASATKNIHYDGRYPDYDATNQQEKPDSFPKKSLKPLPELLNKDSYSIPQTQSVQTQGKRSNVYNTDNKSTDEKLILHDDTLAQMKPNENGKGYDRPPASENGDYYFDGYYGYGNGYGYDYPSQIKDDNPISSTIIPIKNKNNKDDQSGINDKIADIGYADNKQLSIDKSVNNEKDKKVTSVDTSTTALVGSTNKDGIYDDDDYYYLNYDDDGDYEGSAKNDDISPDKHLIPITKQNPANDDVKDKSPKVKPKQQTDVLNIKNASKNNKQAGDYPDTNAPGDKSSGLPDLPGYLKSSELPDYPDTNAPGDKSNLKTVPKSKELALQKDKLYSIPDYVYDHLQKPSKQSLTPIADDQQKDKSDPLYLQGYDDDGLQKTSTQLPPLIADDQQNSKSLDIGQKNADFKKADNTESKDRVKILMKWALDCINDKKFNYTTYSNVIATMAKKVQQTHPDWGSQKSQTTVLIETIFGLIQLLLKSNIKDVKNANKQLQKISDPIQLPPKSQQIYSNVPQNNQDPNYQIGQKNENPPPSKQGNPNIYYIAPEQSVVYPPQNLNVQQNKWDNNQNLYPVVQPILEKQSEPVNVNAVPQQVIPNVPENTALNNNWNVANQNLYPLVQPIIEKQSEPVNVNAVQQQSIPNVLENTALNNNWNVVNPAWSNNFSPITNNNANFQQVRQLSLIPGPTNTIQENWTLNDKTFSPSQTKNSNVGLPNINNFQEPSGQQSNFLSLQQREVNYPGVWQSRNAGSRNYAQSSATADAESTAFTETQRKWVPLSNIPPISNIQSNPISPQNRNQEVTLGQSYSTFIPNDQRYAGFPQTANQGNLQVPQQDFPMPPGNQDFRRARQFENPPQNNQWFNG